MPLSSTPLPSHRARYHPWWVLLALWLWLPLASHAQTAPAWNLATTGSNNQRNGFSFTQAVATDASGNVFVTGFFSGQVAFGNTVLTNQGNDNDLFVAKYLPASGTWAWAQSGGGSGSDAGNGIVVSGNNVYVTGFITNNAGNANNVLFGDPATPASMVPQSGASPTSSPDLFVAKYTDNGTSATVNWTQVGGGSYFDQGNSIAVSGSSVYVTGYIYNNLGNDNAVLFGGSGTTAGTVRQNGASATAGSDLLVAKYTDNGNSATLGWTQVGGGTDSDQGNGIAVNGSSVYVTGYINNTIGNNNAVLFGGTGTTAGTVQQNGASTANSQDLLVVKYTDNGTSATVNWTQLGGGISTDQGTGIAVSGSSVYVTGFISNTATDGNTVRFGGSGTTAGTVQQNGISPYGTDDLLVVKYTDNGASATVNWTQVGGGTSTDRGYGIAVSGNGVYVTGSIINNAANGQGVLFGGTGTTAGTVRQNGTSTENSRDLLVAKYTDNGTSATVNWTQVGGGSSLDQGYGIAVSGNSVYAAGELRSTSSTFGTVNTSSLNGTGSIRAILGQLTTTGTWQAVASSSNGGYQITTQAVATDASGNIFVTGSFAGQALFGNITLNSQGRSDLFVAKYLPASGTWAWAQSGGGTDNDGGLGIAVRGNSVYVTGFIYNNTSNSNAVLFGSTGATVGTVRQNGANPTQSSDLFVAKYTDNGTSATVNWTQVGGGSSTDQGNGIAVSGSSVYVTGYLYNNAANSQGVLFGGTGTTVGTVRQNGVTSVTSPDLVVAKYTDNGTSATLGWTQVGGGTSDDTGSGIAVNGSSVYVTGYLTNSTTNGSRVLFGGSGTTAGTVQQNGASPNSSPDLVVAKYTDNGTSATLGWTQVGGGFSNDQGKAIAVNGTSVYATGFIYNNAANTSAALFGGAGTTAGTVQQSGASTTSSLDLVVAKYTDNGTSATLGWTQVGGGSDTDQGNGIAVSGSSVYVTGYLTNNTANASAALFGGAGTTAGTVPRSGVTATTSADLLVAKYTDNGTSAALGWTQVGGGTNSDIGYGVAVSGRAVYAAGSVVPVATFGSYSISQPPNTTLPVLASLLDIPLPTLTSLSPTSGPVGTSVTLTGTNFTSGSTVSFNGTAATSVTFASASSLTAVVPTGATSGNVTVTTSNGTSNGLPFTVTPPLVTWTGSLSTDWYAADNWTPAQVPNALLDVTIPNAPAGNRFPTIGTGSANARNLTLNAGATLAMSDGTLTLAGSLTNNGTLTATGGTVSLGSSTPSSVLGSSNSSFWNLTVGSSGAQQSTSATTSVQRLLTLNGSFTTNGNPFTLLSDATGTAMVVNTGSYVVSGNVTVQRYIADDFNPGLGYRHVAAPVGTATVGSLATGSFSPVVNPAYNTSATPGTVTPFPTVYGYDQNRLATTTNNLAAFDKGWFSPSATTDALTVGQGYTVLIGAGQTWNFTGPLNNGNVALSLARNAGATASASGLALVGNPYPSPLDWRAVQTTDRPGLDAAIYVFQSTDPNSPYSGVYGFYQNGVGTISPLLAQGQAFFVRVTPGQTSGTLNLNNGHRPLSYAATTYRRTATETRPLVHLALQAAGSMVSDDAFVYFQAGATSGYDAQYDAEKLSNPSGLNLSTILSTTQRLSIDGRAPLGTAQLVIPLAVGVPAVGSYTLRAAELLNLAGTPTTLRDLQTGTVVDLAQQPSYSFTVSNASALITNRFELVFSPQQALAAAPAALAQQVALYPNPATGMAFVILPASLGRQPVPAALLDALGRPVRTLTLPAQGTAVHTLDLRTLPSGVYLLRLDTPAGTLVKKLTVE